MSYWVIGILVFLLVDFLFVLWIFVKRSRGKNLGTKQMQYIKSHWIRIIDSFSANPKNAVMDADKLLDYALKCHGFEGSLGEKMKKAGPRFSDLDGIWNAHKLRNRLAHELGDVPMSECKRALAQFKKALNNLGAGL